MINPFILRYSHSDLSPQPNVSSPLPPLSRLGEHKQPKRTFACSHLLFYLPVLLLPWMNSLCPYLMPALPCALDPIPLANSWTTLQQFSSLSSIVTFSLTELVTLAHSTETLLIKKKKKNLLSIPYSLPSGYYHIFFLLKMSSIFFLSSTSTSIQSNPLQAGIFRSHYSTKAAFIEVTNDPFVARSVGQFLILILQDVLAAFDTVHHSLLF